MKLRIEGRSLRLRLSPSDLETFAHQGRIEESVHFPNGTRLTYSVETSDEVDDLEARFDGEHIVVRLPRAYAAEWKGSDRVGFDAVQSLDDGDRLRVLLEKDLGCKHRRSAEEDSTSQVSDDASALR